MALDPILLTLAFAAGVISFFSPCTVAMLPAYVGYFVGRDEEDGDGDPASDAPARRRPWLAAGLAIPGAAAVLFGLWEVFAQLSGFASLSFLQVGAILSGTALLGLGLRFLVREPVVRGARFGMVTSVGILLVFLLVGFPIAYVVGSIPIDVLAAPVMGIGAVLIGIGIWTLSGRSISVTVPWTAPKERDAVSAMTFGVGYGVVSTGCNLPIFGSVLFGAAASGSVLDGMATFLFYGLGVAALMIAVSVSIAAGKGLTDPNRLTGPWVKRATGAVLVLAGAYIIYYYYVFLTTGIPPL